MKPEGDNKSAIIVLKFIVMSWLATIVAITGAALLMSAQTGRPYMWVLRGLMPTWTFAMLLWIVFGIVLSQLAKLVSAAIQFDSRDTFVSNVSETLIKHQYQPAHSEENTLTFRATFPVSVFFDAVCIHIGENNAKILGPRVYVQRVLDAVGGESER